MCEEWAQRGSWVFRCERPLTVSRTRLPLPQALLEKDLAVGKVTGQSKAAVNADELAGHVGNLDGAFLAGIVVDHRVVGLGGELADEAAPIPLEEPVTKQAGRDKSLTFG